MFESQIQKKSAKTKNIKLIKNPKKNSQGYFYSRDFAIIGQTGNKRKKIDFSRNKNTNSILGDSQISQLSQIYDIRDMKLKIDSYFQKELKMVNLYRQSLNDGQEKTQHEELTVNYDFLMTKINKQRESLYKNLTSQNYNFKEFLFLSNFYKSKIFEMNTQIFKLLDQKIDVSVGQESEVISFMDSLHQKEKIRKIQNGLIGKIDKMEEYRKKISKSIGSIRGSKRRQTHAGLKKIVRKKPHRSLQRRERILKSCANQPKIRILTEKSAKKKGNRDFLSEVKKTDKKKGRRTKRFITFTKSPNIDNSDADTIIDESSSSSKNEEKSIEEFEMKKKSTMATEATEADFMISRSRQSLPKLPSLSKSSVNLTPIISPKMRHNIYFEGRGARRVNSNIRSDRISRKNRNFGRPKKVIFEGKNTNFKIFEGKKKFKLEVPRLEIGDNRSIEKGLELDFEEDDFLLESERAKQKIQSYYDLLEASQEK